MGSCLLVSLMKDKDVYVMNVDDIRAIVEQYESKVVGYSLMVKGQGDNGSSTKGIVEESFKSLGESISRLQKTLLPMQ
ncbi:hypothetical protein ACOSQ4_005066 [Xanthoceras sorbifolium]